MEKLFILFCALLLIIGVAIFIFVLWDTPIVDAASPRVTVSPDYYPRVIIVHGDSLTPEEDTAHYITQDGRLILYDRKDPE